MLLYKDLKLKKRRREREREQEVAIYIRCGNAYKSPYARGSAYNSESGGAIRATHIIVSQVAT